MKKIQKNRRKEKRKQKFKGRKVKLTFSSLSWCEMALEIIPDSNEMSQVKMLKAFSQPQICFFFLCLSFDLRLTLNLSLTRSLPLYSDSLSPTVCRVSTEVVFFTSGGRRNFWCNTRIPRYVDWKILRNSVHFRVRNSVCTLWSYKVSSLYRYLRSTYGMLF
jgi:hypothetical protein